MTQTALEDTRLLESPINWRDLESHEIYDIAHLEYEAWNQSNSLKRRASASDDPFEMIDQAEKLIDDQNVRSEKWLGAFAILKASGFSETDTVPADLERSSWLNGLLLNSPGYQQIQITRDTGLSKGYISAIKLDTRPRRGPSVEAAEGIVTSIASGRGLVGRERENFITTQIAIFKILRDAAHLQTRRILT